MQSSPAIRHGEVARRMAQGAASVPGPQEEAAALDSWAGVGGAGPSLCRTGHGAGPELGRQARAPLQAGRLAIR